MKCLISPVFLSVLALPFLCISGAVAETPSLAGAMLAADAAQIQLAADALKDTLADTAGVEAEESLFLMPQPETKTLQPEDVQTGFATLFSQIEKNNWWKNLKSPGEAETSLRTLASVVDGCVAAEAAGCAEADKIAALGKSTAEVLLKFHQEAGGKAFPLPGWTDKKGKLPQTVARAILAAQAAGNKEFVKSGWVVADLGGGELYLENAQCAVALLHYHEHTKDANALSAAKAAGDWAASQPLVTLWSTNATQVWLFSELHRVTKDAKHLQAAKKFAQLGVLPGQLKAGPNEGRWVDGQSARVVHHFTILRGLAHLWNRLEPDDPLHAELESALLSGLVVRNAEIISRGACHPETTAELFIYMAENPAFATLAAATQSEDAANITFRGLSEEYRNAHPTLTPSMWGSYLRFVKNHPPEAK